MYKRQPPGHAVASAPQPCSPHGSYGVSYALGQPEDGASTVDGSQEASEVAVDEEGAEPQMVPEGSEGGAPPSQHM